MRYKFLFAAFICFLINTSTFAIQEHEHCGCEFHHHISAPKNITDESILSIKDCISIGLQNSPIIKEHAYMIDIAKNNTNAAKSIFFPELSAHAGYTRGFNTNVDDFEKTYRELPYVGVYLKQMIWDFGKTIANIRMEEFLKIAAQYEFEDSVCSSVFEIKTHYYKLLKAKAEYEAEKTNLDIEENIVKDIEKLVKAGKKNNSDLSNAKTELLTIKSNLLIKEDNLKNSWEELNNAMYFQNAPNYTIYETQSFSYNPQKQTVFKNVNYIKKGKISKDDTIFQHPNFSYEKAVEIAYNNSPDIHALEATKNAMEQSLLSVKRQFYPEINVGAGYDFVRTLDNRNNNFNIGIEAESSLNALKQKFDVGAAKAQLNLANTQIDTFKKNLYYAVRKNLNSVKTTYKNIPISEEKMKISAENFRLNYDAFLKGYASESTMESTRKSYYNSLIENINAQYDYNIALIKLEKSMHQHLIDYHDDAEHAIKYHHGNENNVLKKLIFCKKKHKTN